MTAKHPQKKKVFISYSHDSKEHLERVVKLSERLRKDGIEATIDQYEQSPEEGWLRWMERQVRESDSVLVVCTERYLRKAEDPDEGSGVAWESMLSHQEIYKTRRNRKFIPVVFGRADRMHVPEPLRAYTIHDLGAEEGYELLYRQITDQPYFGGLVSRICG